MALIDDIFKRMNDYDRRLRALETTPQPPNISTLTSSTASFTLNPLAIDWFSVSISHADNYKFLAVPSIVIYKDSISAANRYPDGANWTDAERGAFNFFNWIDKSLSDGNNIYWRLVFINYNNTITFNLIFQVEYRYLLKGAS